MLRSIGTYCPLHPQTLTPPIPYAPSPIPTRDSAFTLPADRLATQERRPRRRLRRPLVALVAVVAVVACFVPIPRAVTLEGTLVPERLFTIRASEPGLVAEVFVAAGDTVHPGQPLVRLESPSLMEAFRTTDVADPTLLDRFDRLTLAAPPWATAHPDGTTDLASIFTGGVVLTEDLDRTRGSALQEGEPFLEIAALDADQELQFVIHATSDARAASRLRAGMRARVRFVDAPPEKAPLVWTTVRRIGLAPSPTSEPSPSIGWRVKADLPSNVSATSDYTLRPFAPVEMTVVAERTALAPRVWAWLNARNTATLADPIERFADLGEN